MAAAKQFEWLGLPLRPFGQTIDRLRCHSNFYKRDEKGEYWQLSSRAFRRRFFSEVVQREGYDGYLAPNELIRLASQSRFKDEGEVRAQSRRPPPNLIELGRVLHLLSHGSSTLSSTVVASGIGAATF